MIAKAIRPQRPRAVVKRGKRPIATSSQAGRKNDPEDHAQRKHREPLKAATVAGRDIP